MISVISDKQKDYHEFFANAIDVIDKYGADKIAVVSIGNSYHEPIVSTFNANDCDLAIFSGILNYYSVQDAIDDRLSELELEDMTGDWEDEDDEDEQEI